MSKCWEFRGCDEEMQGRCPHAVQPTYHPCPLDCRYTDCPRPTHKRATDMALIFDETIDRNAVAKEACRYCEFFLKNGPRVEEEEAK